MNQFLPFDSTLSISCLNKIFDNTTASYKYLWFLSLLDLNVQGKNHDIPVYDIIAKMLSYAWYPINYFHLSFGSWDSMEYVVSTLRKELNLPIDTSRNKVEEKLKEACANDNNIKKILAVFTKNVPYRFLSPWLKETNEKKAIEQSKTFINDCLYSISSPGLSMKIDINHKWIDYLERHYIVLRDFSLWNFQLFLQKMNPNVPAIGSKILKPEERASLSRQRAFWKSILQVSNNPIKCIYTDKPLGVSDFALDHFVPWSFVCHDLLWNLIPANPSINSSKSDLLPDLNYHLPKMAKIHQEAIKTILGANLNNVNKKILDDFLTLKQSPQDLAQISFDAFLRIYQDTFTPLVLVAKNMGYDYWHNNSACIDYNYDFEIKQVAADPSEIKYKR